MLGPSPDPATVVAAVELKDQPASGNWSRPVRVDRRQTEGTEQAGVEERDHAADPHVADGEHGDPVCSVRADALVPPVGGDGRLSVRPGRDPTPAVAGVEDVGGDELPDGVDAR